MGMFGAIATKNKANKKAAKKNKKKEQKKKKHTLRRVNAQLAAWISNL